jgi:hypothetical protein
MENMGDIEQYFPKSGIKKYLLNQGTAFAIFCPLVFKQAGNVYYFNR